MSGSEHPITDELKGKRGNPYRIEWYLRTPYPDFSRHPLVGGHPADASCPLITPIPITVQAYIARNEAPASLAASSAGAEAAAAASFSRADASCLQIARIPIAIRDDRPERSTGVVGGVIGRSGGGGGCLLLRRQLPASVPFECAAGSE